MPRARVNGVDLNYEVMGKSSPPLVLVHGSWVGSGSWAFVAPELGKSFRVITYDRRGHDGSANAPRSGTVTDDVEDLAGLLSHLGIDAAHIVGGSFGATISLRFAAAHPAQCLSLNAHEPPIIDYLKLDPAAAELHQSFVANTVQIRQLLERGENEAGARTFVEGLFPGSWDTFPLPARQAFAANGPTFLDEILDSDSFTIPRQDLEGIRAPVLLTDGSASPELFPRILKQVAPHISGAQRFTFEGAGHVPQQSHPQEFIDRATRFALSSG